MISDWLSVVFYLLGDLNNSAYMQAFNCLNANSTKWSNTSNNSLTVVDKLFEFVWLFCGVDAERVSLF